MVDERIDQLIEIIIKQNRENTVLRDEVDSLKEDVALLHVDLCAWKVAALGGQGEETQPFIIS
jgi:hypothetical protein